MGRSPYEPRLPPKPPLKQRPALSPYGNERRKVYPPMETKTPIQAYCGDDKRKAAMMDIAARIVNKIDKITVVDNLYWESLQGSK